MITPLFNLIQIEIAEAETVTASGIILDTKAEKLEKATVVAVGDDVVRVKTGDTILFKSYTSDAITIDGKEVAFIKEDDVLALYETRA